MKLYALWYQKSIGLEGYVYGLYGNDQQKLIIYSICSALKWGFGNVDSLRKGWQLPTELIKWTTDNYEALDFTEAEFKKYGAKACGAASLLCIREFDMTPHDAYRIWPNGKSIHEYGEPSKDSTLPPTELPPLAIRQAFPNIDLSIIKIAKDEEEIKARRDAYMAKTAAL